MASAATTLLLSVQFLFLIWSGCPTDAGAVFADPTRTWIARCRATCLDDEYLFSESLSTCRSKPECFMCWETCEMFITNFDLWGTMCFAETICFTGCQKSCTFYQNMTDGSLQDSSDNTPWWFDRSVTLDNNPAPLMTTLKWKKPYHQRDFSTSKESALIYLIAQRNEDKGPWEEILQTLDQHATISSSLLRSEKIKTKLFAVTMDGVVAETSLNNNLEFEAKREKEDQNVKASWFETWTPTLLSLHVDGHNQAEASLAWSSIPLALKYDVSWKLIGDAMDVTGHLYTWSNNTSLSLYLGSLYSIQVSGLSSEGKLLGTSPSLIVNTMFLETRATTKEDDLDKSSNCYGAQSSLIFVLCSVGACGILVSVCAIAWLFKILREKNEISKQESALPTTCPEKALSPLTLVHKKLSLVPGISEKPLAPRLSLAKKLSRKLSNLEMQYSPLSPLRNCQKNKEGLITAENPEEYNNAFFFPGQKDISE